MSSPVGHLLFGIILLPIAKEENKDFRSKGMLYFLCLVCTIFPDFDFIPGILLGDVNRFHQGISHSFFGGVIVSCGIAGFFMWRYKGNFLRLAIVFYAFYLSHLFLDLMLVDRLYPYGIPLFSPFSDTRYQFPIQFLPGIDRAEEPGRFLPSLFSGNNFKAVIIEIGIFGTFFLIKHIFRNYIQVPSRSFKQNFKNQ